MYEIIAHPKDYQIDHLINGTGNANSEISQEEREKWAAEIVNFSEKIAKFAEKSKAMAALFTGDEKIAATPASLKTLKIQLFTINDALTTAMEVADKIESEIVEK